MSGGRNDLGVKVLRVDVGCAEVLRRTRETEIAFAGLRLGRGGSGG
jgi:hypothetical protein